MNKLFLLLIGFAVVLSSCVFGEVMEEEEVEEVEVEEVEVDTLDPLTYDLGGVEADVSVEEVAFGDLFTAAGLEAGATECGTPFEGGSFEWLVEQMEDNVGYKYSFTYLGESQDPTGYEITLMPNTMEYSIDGLKADFDICAVGGQYYPTDVNDEWMLFVGSCGSGYADGSGLPIGCSEVKENLEYSF